MRTRPSRRKRKDVAASCASLLFNLLPFYAAMPEPVLYRRLAAFIEGCFNAYDDVPEPMSSIEPSAN
jgi:hypothetical protein